MPVHVLEWESLAAAACHGGAIAIGNFDGVHRGHAVLIAEVRRQALAVVGPAVAVTFDPHPLQLLRPVQFQPVLTTPRDRAELLLATGADEVVILHTTPQLLQLPAADFFAQVVCQRLAARALVEGSDFHFGRGREGTVSTLTQLCHQSGMTCTIVPPVTVDGVTVSSSRVRTALLAGDAPQAERLLGRPYRVRGLVGTGQHRGRTLGFPTANLEEVGNLLPAVGVYAVIVHRQGMCWPGAANLGPNPTFGEQARKLEVHLIGFEGDLYGQELALDFLLRLRETRPFASAAELTEQLHRDVDCALHVATDRLRNRP